MKLPIFLLLVVTAVNAHGGDNDDQVEISQQQELDIGQLEKTNLLKTEKTPDISQQEQVEIGQVEQAYPVNSGSGYQIVSSGSTSSGKRVVVETTKPKHIVTVESSRPHASEPFVTHGQTQQLEDSQQEQVEIGQEELVNPVNSGSGYHKFTSGSSYHHKPGGRVVVIETTRESIPKHTVGLESSGHQTIETFENPENKKTAVGQQEQVELGQEELANPDNSGSGYHKFTSGSSYHHKPGGKVVVVETTRESIPKHNVGLESSGHQTIGTFEKHENEQTAVGQQEQVELGQVEQSYPFNSGSGSSGYHRVTSGSSYHHRPGGRVVVVETTRETIPKHNVGLESSVHQTIETFENPENKQTVVGQQEQVELGQEELANHVNSGSGYHKFTSGSSYHHKPGGKVVVVETMRESIPKHNVGLESSGHKTIGTFEKHENEQTAVGQQEQLELGQVDQSYPTNSGSGSSGYHRVTSGSSYHHRPGGRVVVIETTRETIPKHTVGLSSGRHTSETSGTHGNDPTEADQQKQVELGQVEQSYPINSGLQNSGYHRVNLGSSRPGGRVVVIETTREVVSKPKHVVTVESSRHPTQQIEDDQQEQIELEANPEYHKVTTGSLYNQKPNGDDDNINQNQIVETTSLTQKPVDKVVNYVQMNRELSSNPSGISQIQTGNDLNDQKQVIQTTVTKESTGHKKHQDTKG